MKEIETTNIHEGPQKLPKPNKTWGHRLKSSLAVGLMVSGVWVLLMMSGVWVVLMRAAGSYHPLAGGAQGAAGMSTILGNAFGMFVISSGVAFMFKAILYNLGKTKNKTKHAKKPPQVNNAVKFLYAALGASIPGQVISAQDVPVWLWVLVIAIIIGIYILLIDRISTGRNWARIAMLILFLLALPSFFSTLQEFYANLFLSFLKVAQIALHGIALVFLFRQPSNDWFKQ